VTGSTAPPRSPVVDHLGQSIGAEKKGITGPQHVFERLELQDILGADRAGEDISARMPPRLLAEMTP
jgi:hypothetical protein